MLRKNLKLNDFKGFDKYLGDDLGVYYKNDIFYVPIPDPKEIAEYQLNHYAYWMVIKTFELSRKPISNEPDCKVCYACRYSNDKKSSRCCPIKSWRGSGCFAPRSLYTRWQIGHNPDYADAIAHLEWEDY